MIKRGIIILFLLNPIITSGEEKTRVAVMDIKGNVKEEMLILITNAIIDGIVSTGRFDVIDRMNRDKILKEQGFQLTPVVDERTRVEVGRILGVQKMITGDLSFIDDTYFLSIQLLDVETGKIEASEIEKCFCSFPRMLERASYLGKKLLGVKEEETKEEVEIPKRKEKSVFTAGTLSLFIGFGSGNFYGGSHFEGIISLMGQVLGGGILATGLIQYNEGNGENLVIAGGTIFGIARIFDFIYSIVGTKRNNEKLKEMTFYPSIIFSKGNAFIGCGFQF